MEKSFKNTRHPCFSIDAAHDGCKRLHLPVAPECNIKCSYCNRKFDCVNESRPGVTSSILSPEEALERVKIMVKRFPDLKIAGIAGPGDALANSQSTFKTMRMIREYDKEIEFCLSTNGVNLVEYLAEIKDVEVRYITITINSLKVEVARTLYKWAKDGETFLKGANAAKFILERQKQALDVLKGSGIYLKVNTIYIPGVNDFEIEDIAWFARNNGVDIVNIMPFIPTPGTYFQNFPMVSRKTLNQIQEDMSLIIPQMRHCQQCRADAAGSVFNEKPIFIENDIVRDLSKYQVRKHEKDSSDNKVIRFAVTSKSGYIVDQHFGHAADLLIYDVSGMVITFIERREINKYCAGKENCEDPEERISLVKEKLSDCQGLLVFRIGDMPKKSLEESGLYVTMTYDRIESAIRENYEICNSSNGAVVRVLGAG